MPAGRRWSSALHKWVKQEELVETNDEQEEESWCLLFSYFRWYPDRFLEIMEGDEADFHQHFIQALIWRIDARYEETFITGPRGLSKTYTKVSGVSTDLVLWPGEKVRYFGPTMEQAADLAKSAFAQVAHNYPFLADQISIKTDQKGEFCLKTESGSEFRISVKRGDNCHQVVCEECGQEDGYPFDHKKYQEVVKPTVRLPRNIAGRVDPTHVNFKKHYITTASSQQNDAYGYRCKIFQKMIAGESAYALDIPWTVSVLAGIRSLSYYKSLKEDMTPDAWARECESFYTGATQNPVISDTALTRSQVLNVMEDCHCGDPNCIYIIGYDVSHEEGAGHAMCATSVVKLTEQDDPTKQDVFLKQIVYLEDFTPMEASLQAQYLKDMWMKYSIEHGEHPTLIAIDDKQYGKSVTEQLMKDMGDGIPLCCFDHEYSELELPGALPVIHPVKASNGKAETGNSDPEGEMLKYAKMQFENGNVQMIVPDYYTGVEAYKQAHNINNPTGDIEISKPYIKCHEMCAQIKNLSIKYSSMNWAERRKNNLIQRDLWSATKYALRMAQLLERKRIVERAYKPRDIQKEIAAAKAQRSVMQGFNSRTSFARRRGRLF